MNVLRGTVTGVSCFVVLVLLLGALGSLGLAEEALCFAVAALVGAATHRRNRNRRETRLGA